MTIRGRWATKQETMAHLDHAFGVLLPLVEADGVFIVALALAVLAEESDPEWRPFAKDLEEVVFRHQGEPPVREVPR